MTQRPSVYYLFYFIVLYGGCDMLTTNDEIGYKLNQKNALIAHH